MSKKNSQPKYRLNNVINCILQNFSESGEKTFVNAVLNWQICRGISVKVESRTLNQNKTKVK